MIGLVSHIYGDMVRHHHVFSRYCDNVDGIEICLDDCDINSLYEQYDHLVFGSQAPRNYNFNIQLKDYVNNNNTFFVRPNTKLPIVNKATNGFSIYKNGGYNYFNPWLTNYSVDDSGNDVTIGFYLRSSMVRDSYMWFMDFIRNLKIDVDVYVMGENIVDFGMYDSVRKYKHTYDQDEFFSNITHYIYPESCDFIDPFPHTIMEAVQSGSQVVIPKIGERGFTDGIDDIKSLIKYHDTFNVDKLYDNSIDFNVFNGFYKKVVDSNFSYEFDSDRYKTFYDWIVGEVT